MPRPNIYIQSLSPPSHRCPAARGLPHESVLDEALPPLLQVLRRHQPGPLLRVHLARLPPAEVGPVHDLEIKEEEEQCISCMALLFHSRW